MSRAKYTSTATSVPSWVTAVNDAPASSAKNTREAIARCPEDDTGRNSVSPCRIDENDHLDPRHRRHVRHDDDRTVGRVSGWAAAPAALRRPRHARLR